jgi:hypothetical protein
MGIDIPDDDDDGTQGGSLETICPICEASVGLGKGTCPHWLCVTLSEFFLPEWAPGIIGFETEVRAVADIVGELQFEDWFDEALETVDGDIRGVVRLVREWESGYWLKTDELISERWSNLDSRPAGDGYWCFHQTPRRFARAIESQARRVTSTLKELAKRFEQP